MSTLANLIFLLALAAMFVVYPMYFIGLYGFWKTMIRDHSDLVGQQRINLVAAYSALQSIKNGRLANSQLTPDALAAHSRAKRLLYLAMALFIVVFFFVLTDALLGKNFGWA